jgi:Lrp/AsnC family leucine-responsive transcriptional regulator
VIALLGGIHHGIGRSCQSLGEIKLLMPKMNLDVLDLKILRTLQAEGRLTHVELADRIGLSPSPCLRRVKRLEAEGIIEGYGARINRAKVGVGVTVFVAVGLERHREEEAERFRKVVQRLRQVISCHAISGESDFLLEIVVADLQEYSEFVLKRLRRIPGVKDLHSSFALEAMKTTSLPLPGENGARPPETH